MVAALGGGAVPASSRCPALAVVVARSCTMSGVAAATVSILGLYIGLGRPLACHLVPLRVRAVTVASAAMHEEHRDRASEQEKQKKERRRIHWAPPFIGVNPSVRREREGQVKLVCCSREVRRDCREWWDNQSTVSSRTLPGLLRTQHGSRASRNRGSHRHARWSPAPSPGRAASRRRGRGRVLRGA